MEKNYIHKIAAKNKREFKDNSHLKSYGQGIDDSLNSIFVVIQRAYEIAPAKEKPGLQIALALMIEVSKS